MSVDELALLYGLDLTFNRPGNEWLFVGRVGGATIDRLARLARIEPAMLNSMQGGLREPVRSPQIAYCPSCLFLNPLDVTSPCWKQDWLTPSASGCAIHAQSMTRLSITALRTCDNFDKLLRVISRRERLRRSHSR